MDVFAYDELTTEFRQKIAHAFADLYDVLEGGMGYSNKGAPLKLFKRELARALGAPGVPNPHDYFVKTTDVNPVLRWSGGCYQRSCKIGATG